MALFKSYKSHLVIEVIGSSGVISKISANVHNSGIVDESFSHCVNVQRSQQEGGNRQNTCRTTGNIYHQFTVVFLSNTRVFLHLKHC